MNTLRRITPRIYREYYPDEVGRDLTSSMRIYGVNEDEGTAIAAAKLEKVPIKQN